MFKYLGTSRLWVGRGVQVVLLLVLLAVAVVQSFSDARWRQQIQNFSFDNYNILKPRQSSDRIVIIDIDEASLSKIGQMPWPRTVMADLVNRLKTLGAKVIVFDIVFAESDRSSPSEISRTLKNLQGFDSMQEKLALLPENDVIFGQAIADAQNVVTGFSFTNEKTDSSPAQKGIFRGKNIERFVPNLQGASANLRAVSKNAAGNGSFFVSTDIDGIIRRVPMLVAHNRSDSEITTIYPSLSLEAVRVFDGVRGGKIILADTHYADLDPSRFGIQGVSLGQGADSRFIPTNGHGEFLVYFAKSQPDWYISAHKVLNDKIEADAIKDKIVLIGTSAVGLKDIRSTPLETFLPGVEVHLNIIDQILQGKFLQRSIEAEGIEAVSILTVGLFIVLFAPFIGALAQAVIVAALVAGLIALGWIAFSQHGMLVDVAYPSISVLAIFMVSTILTYLRTERERREVRDAFGLYISPEFMEELTRDPDKLKLGGEIRDLTVMFTDIRSFTTISEGLTPEELIQLMNDFLTPMSDLVMQNRGTIDKYMGDAMMAFWNAPLDDAAHQHHACLAALGMQAALGPINESVREKALELGKEPVLLQAGIGINTGPCAVGNMGSRQRFAYSALGDAVNLASRLEGQTKTYGIDILIGENTAKAVEDFAILEIDLIKVKGKTKPERIFGLLGDEKEAETDTFQTLKKTHNQMLESYRNANFEIALAEVKQCARLGYFSMDKAYMLYQERIKALIQKPPGGEWSGVCEAQDK